jgi:hypothetical protein
LKEQARPKPTEWSVLASIVAEHLDPVDPTDPIDPTNSTDSAVPNESPNPTHSTDATPQHVNRLELICLASGTKLITGTISRQVPNLLLDCHAEVLCRRLFKRWLLDRLSDPDWSEAKLERIRLHMFVSQLPCGSIVRYQGDGTTPDLHLAATLING